MFNAEFSMIICGNEKLSPAFGYLWVNHCKIHKSEIANLKSPSLRTTTDLFNSVFVQIIR
jgi:hypothetical protein